MKVSRLVLGQLMTNCYIAGDGNSVAVIDPAADAEKILRELGGREAAVILLTHGHFDHTGALCDLKEKTGAKVYIHRLDEPCLGDMEKSLAFMTGEEQRRCEPDVLLEGGETILFGENSLKVIHTPGHSAGSVTYVSDECVFSGDLIFKGSIGRFDYGNYADEMNSIKMLTELLSEDTVICPGHGDVTSVGYEKKNNPYIA